MILNIHWLNIIKLQCWILFFVSDSAFKADYIAESPSPSLFSSTYCSHYPPRTVSWGLRSSRLPCVVLVFHHSLSRWTSPGNGMQPSSKAHFRINFQNNLLMTHNCEPKRDSAFSTVLVDRQTNKIITTVIIEHCQHQKKKKRKQKHCHQGTLLTNSENWKWCSKILEAWAMESNKLSSDLFQIPPSCATLHKSVFIPGSQLPIRQMRMIVTDTSWSWHRDPVR